MSDRGPFIITASGRPFYLADPRPEEVFLLDILTSMTNLCRYTGHVDWSDAKHLLLCYFIDQSPEVLAHDFPEAYYGDMSRPWKAVLGDAIKPHTKKIDDAVAVALGLDTGFYHLDKVKRVDSEAFLVEKHVFGRAYKEQEDSEIIEVKPSQKAVEYAQFLQRYPAAESRLRGICEAHFTDERLWL